MSNAVPRRSEQPVTIGRPSRGKAKILRFDRHAGVIVMDKAELTSKNRSLNVLVRKLLTILKPNAPAASLKRPQATKFRIRRK